MTTILARSRWTSTSPGGRAVTWSRIRGIVCHYPAMGKSVGVLTPAQETSRLRGWRNYHVGSLGWADIGYNYCITQAGRVYSLRGDRVGAHAVGHNSTTIGVLFMVGDNEPLTDAARASFRALRATLRKRGASSGVWGHTQMSGNSTRCPGPYIMGDIRSGVLKRASAGASVGGGGTSAPKPSKNLWDTSPRIRGMSKADVKHVQSLLVGAGYSVGSHGVDGSYKADTVAAVRKAQKALGVTVDGVAGPDTIKALEKAQKDGKPAAKPVKKKVAEDGRAGRETISELQRQLGVKADGRAGEATWRALQRKLGVKPVDGKIGWQSYRPKELGNGIVDRDTAWGFTGRGSKGSPTVKALQKHIGMSAKDQDGIWHDKTSLALQRALNTGKF